ncbi:hypothetical protein CN404_26455, partial [Bacillus thuringiensis]|uniref:hypothetical protein n=1 Tax=Bacillus thuringiensis TaxID=1428 RepID=UPI000BFABC80
DQTDIPDSRTVFSGLLLLNQTIIRTGPGIHQLELRIAQSTANPANIEGSITSMQVIRIS